MEVVQVLHRVSVLREVVRRLEEDGVVVLDVHAGEVRAPSVQVGPARVHRVPALFSERVESTEWKRWHWFRRRRHWGHMVCLYGERVFVYAGPL